MAENQIRAVSYTHEALINWMIANPHRNLRDAAAYFGYTQAWISTIIHSDIFQAKLAERQNAVFALVAGDIPAKLRAVTDVAIEKVGRAIENSEDSKFLLDAADKLLHRMGYAPASARNPIAAGPVVNVNQTNNFTVNASDLAAARQMQRDLAGEGMQRMQLVEAQAEMVEAKIEGPSAQAGLTLTVAVVEEKAEEVAEEVKTRPAYVRPERFEEEPIPYGLPATE